MEEKNTSTRLESNDAKLGHGKILSSFLSANNQEGIFGTFISRIPKSFNDEFGRQMTSDLILHCNSLIWKGNYDQNSMLIYGLRRFMRFYGVKIYNLLQFEYYGENQFVIKIFKDTAVECNYQTKSLEDFLQTEDLDKWRKDKFLLDSLSLEYEKVSALWMFNALHNYAGYFQIKISSLDIDPNQNNLILQEGLYKLYKNWKDGCKVELMFVARRWEVKVEWKNERCTLGVGWQEFAKDTELENGDTLVLFTLNSNVENLVNVCIFKGEDRIVGFREENMECNKSFFKVISEDSLEEGMLVVPKLIKDTYGETLSDLNQVEIAGERRYIFFSILGGYLANIGKILDVFHVCQRETIIFSLDGNIFHARIYEADGTEIDYSKRVNGCLKKESSNWIWAIDWSDNSDKGNGNGAADHDIDKQNNLIVGSNKMDVDIANFQQFIIVVRANNCESTTIKLPENIISAYGHAIPPNVSFKFRTGRETQVQYNVSSGSFVDLIRLRKELIRCCASFIVFNYNGKGVFLVNILNDDGIEAENVPMRNSSMNPLYNRDKNRGIGWKFLSFGVGAGYHAGEFEIPENFVKRFGDVIPSDVKVILQNGAFINAFYSKTNQKLIGLMDIIESNYFEKKDTLMFTYRGDGIFDIVVFDKTKVEKLLPTTTTARDSEKAFDGITTSEMQFEGQSSGVQNEGQLLDMENDNQILENVEENEMEIEDFVAPVEFIVTLTKSNVNSSSHGVYIPRSITPTDRQWQHGEEVTLTTAAGVWTVGIVVSNGAPRFSAGWNTFAEDNGVKKNQQMVFTLLEEAEGIVFNVHVQ